MIGLRDRFVTVYFNTYERYLMLCAILAYFIHYVALLSSQTNLMWIRTIILMRFWTALMPWQKHNVGRKLATLCALFIYWVHEGSALIYIRFVRAFVKHWINIGRIYRTYIRKNQRKCNQTANNICVLNNGLCVRSTFISWQ